MLSFGKAVMTREELELSSSLINFHESKLVLALNRDAQVKLTKLKAQHELKLREWKIFKLFIIIIITEK